MSMPRRPPNIFVSELGNIQPPWQILVFGLLAYEFLVVLAIVLGGLVGADCMAVQVARGDIIRMGFWCEANHGPLYLLGMPIFYFSAFDFIARSNIAFDYLQRIGRLRNLSGTPLCI